MSVDSVVCNVSPENIVHDLERRFRTVVLTQQATRDAIPTVWVRREGVRDVLSYLKNTVSKPYVMLYDLTGIDERVRNHRNGQPESDFTVVYHLMSFARNEDVRIKVPLSERDLRVSSICDLWPNANWYENEAWDMAFMDS